MINKWFSDLVFKMYVGDGRITGESRSLYAWFIVLTFKCKSSVATAKIPPFQCFWGIFKHFCVDFSNWQERHHFIFVLDEQTSVRSENEGSANLYFFICSCISLDFFEPTDEQTKMNGIRLHNSKHNIFYVFKCVDTGQVDEHVRFQF